MKQTAVEWFFEQLTEVDYGCINKTFLQNNNSLAGHKLRELFEQAKQMEEEEIRVAYMEGAFEKMRHLYGKEFMMPTEYYNETFKSERNVIL